MENLEFIENYFKGTNDDAAKTIVRKKDYGRCIICRRSSFLHFSQWSNKAATVQEEKKQRFREIYDQQKVISIKQPVRNIWKYMAAASVIIAVLLVTWLFTGNKNSPQQLADKYIQQNFTKLKCHHG